MSCFALRQRGFFSVPPSKALLSSRMLGTNRLLSGSLAVNVRDDSGCIRHNIASLSEGIRSLPRRKLLKWKILCRFIRVLIKTAMRISYRFVSCSLMPPQNWRRSVPLRFPYPHRIYVVWWRHQMDWFKSLFPFRLIWWNQRFYGRNDTAA